MADHDNRTNSLRAFTLLEAMIALVLLAGLAAIVAPALIDRLDEHAFESAADGTSEQLLMARAHAQATGEAVQVTYSPATGNVEARFYAPWDVDAEFGSFEPGTSPLASMPKEYGATPSQPELTSAGLSGTGSIALQNDGRQASASSSISPFTRSASSSLLSSGTPAIGSGAGKPITEPWATRPLGKGMRLATQPPFATATGSDGIATGSARHEQEICLPDGTLLTMVADGRDQPYGTFDDSDSIASLDAAGEVRLAVFMPDGSAMIGENLWLDDGRGRLGMISIDAWSGLPVFQRMSALAARADAMRRNSTRELGDGSDRSRTDPWNTQFDALESEYDALGLDDE